MVRLFVRKCFASVPTKSQNASTFSPYNLSFCTNQITKRFILLYVQLFLLYQPNHKLVRLCVRKSFPAVPTKSQNGWFSGRIFYPSVLTNSQKGSSFFPYNFSFCTSRITNWFGFLSVKVLLLYQPNHKTLRLSVRIIYLFVLTNSQKGSSFCRYNFSFCTSQITSWFDCLSVKVFLLYQPNHRMVRLSGRIIYPSVLTNSQKSSSFCPYNFSFCTSQITNWFGFLSENVSLLYQPNHKMLRFSVRTIYPSVLINSQKCSN